MIDSCRATHVCAACKQRKKTCDKQLPACGFCSSRKLVCKYEASSKKVGAPNPGIRFVPIPEIPSSDATALGQPTPRENRSSPGWTSSTASVAQLDAPIASALGALITSQVGRILRAIDLSKADIAPLYFQCSQQWLPIISIEAFDRMAESQLQTFPRLDFATLFLTMCLIVGVTNAERRGDSDACGTKPSYAAVKSVFSAVQGGQYGSTTLIQAGLLLAEYEYVCCSPDVAYITIFCCIQLARDLKLSARGMSSSFGRIDNKESDVHGTLVAMETLIYAELNARQQAVTRFDYLIKSPIGHNSRHFGAGQIPASHSSTSANSPRTEMDEALHMLEDVTQLCSSTRDGRTTSMIESAELDRRIRAFLTSYIHQEQQTGHSMAVPIALLIRSLFIIHESSLENIARSGKADDDERTRASWAALDAVCDMVVDAGRTHKFTKHGAFPLCCVYNMESALKHLQKREGVDVPPELLEDIALLEHSKKQYQNIWKV